MRAAVALLVLSACATSAPVSIAVRSVSQPAQGTAPTILHTLDPATEGWAVRGALTQVGDRLYGLAGEAGPNGTPNCNSTANWNTIEHTQHCPGALFSVGMDGTFKVEHAFSRLDDTKRNTDGYHSYGTLALGPDGRLYGVAQMGGSPPSWEGKSTPGSGTLYRYNPTTGEFQTLHSFFGDFHADDGLYPMGALAIDGRGNVYGQCKGGGKGGTGTVFEWSPSGAFRYAPLPGEGYGGLTLADGILHGTTWSGGDHGKGVYFTVDPETLEVRTVASFDDFAWNAHGTDATPVQEPTLLSDGSVVVAREFGGAFGAGIIVQLSSGGIRVLHDSADIPLDAPVRFANTTGSMLNGRIVEGRDGMLYGNAQYGGTAGTGGIYRMSRDGSLFQLIWSWPDSAYSYGGPTIGGDGALWGVTFGTGRIWRLAPPGICQ